MTNKDTADYFLYRILDANMNRLREGIRVVEEYFRFFCEAPKETHLLKNHRHMLQELEEVIGVNNLLNARDVARDILRDGATGTELSRSSVERVFTANIRRAEESARVIEEYCKVLSLEEAVVMAKKIRFDLYDLEATVGLSGSKKD
ncbi:hypothetical protein [Chitinivibrio alkaliphilus]|uniref:ThiD2 domain-containing protein n=1 Tax=Chitinivibrio alkaliphilus ACht1 TaxID=1313304 RepID=U7D7C5_9BACT|nr:hypothetical protein [Chitinivibrio alkaliphilus]ERP38850.1 hypothetical protein CALK_0625 [Chitinivibrio alkaliphilus ACht1]